MSFEKIKEGDFYALNAPGLRGHFIIVVRVELPLLFLYDTIDKEYFKTTIEEFKRAKTFIAESPDDRHRLPYVDYVKTIPDNIWFPLKKYCEERMRLKPVKTRSLMFGNKIKP